MTDSNLVTLLVVVLSLSILLALWVGILWIVARTSGWLTLSERYAAEVPFNGKRCRCRTIYLLNGSKQAKYKGSIKLKVNEEGLYLRPILLCRVYHPSLYIPWTDISKTTETVMSFSIARLKFKQTPFVSMRISDRGVMHLEEIKGSTISKK